LYFDFTVGLDRTDIPVVPRLRLISRQPIRSGAVITLGPAGKQLAPPWLRAAALQLLSILPKPHYYPIENTNSLIVLLQAKLTITQYEVPCGTIWGVWLVGLFSVVWLQVVNTSRVGTLRNIVLPS
jgi:hypothetical protein